MRCAIVLVLCHMIQAEALGIDKPIPQDLAKIEARRRERLDWHRRTTLDAYDRVGRKNPKWDKSAREVLDRASRMFGEQVDPIISLEETYAPYFPHISPALSLNCPWTDRRSDRLLPDGRGR